MTTKDLNLDKSLDDFDIEMTTTDTFKGEARELLSTNDTTKDTTFNLGIHEKLGRHFGNCCVFLFIKGEPLITIGPHCNFIIICLPDKYLSIIKYFK
jgi:hypothetical protein